MKLFEVALTRTYLVSIRAENEYQARRLSEYYLGDCPDLSNKEEQINHNFHIEKVELAYNEASGIL